jgi:GT2 family glycosyltransferase
MNVNEAVRAGMQQDVHEVENDAANEVANEAANEATRAVASAIQHIAVVILTYNRAAELQHTLERMLSAAHVPRIVVVDNASSDGTAQMVRARFPQVSLFSLPANIGAAARNAGAAAVDTPYIAFSDDDTWWADGSLSRAAALMESHPDVAVLCARVLVGKEEREDPTCTAMAASPLPAEGLPGPALLGFLAGASVIRRSAFLEAGGYEPRFFIGGEEGLLALDLVAWGWRLAYVPELTVHHHPSSLRDSMTRKRCLLRNALWICWMRLPFALALRESWRLLRDAHRDGVMWSGLRDALGGLPWALRRRRVVPRDVVQQYRQLHG